MNQQKKNIQIEIYTSQHRKDYHIAKHNFWFEQFNALVLSQFTDEMIEDEDHKKHSFVVGDYEKFIDFQLNLVDMRQKLILSGLSFLYYNLDKELRQFLTDALGGNYSDNKYHDYIKKIWKLNLINLLNKFKADEKIVKKEILGKLKTLADIVNTFKHGDGPSFKKLKKEKEEYFRADYETNEEYFDIEFKNYDNLNISKDDFEIYSDAIKKFWYEFPENSILEI